MPSTWSSGRAGAFLVAGRRASKSDTIPCGYFRVVPPEGPSRCFTGRYGRASAFRYPQPSTRARHRASRKRLGGDGHDDDRHRVTVGPEEKQPKYLWLAEQIRKPILSGALVPGARLPSRTRLARTYRVSEQISRTALRLLVTEGLVEARTGSGYFVRGAPAPVTFCRTGASSVLGPDALQHEDLGTTQELCEAPVTTRLRLRARDPVYLTISRGVAEDRPATLHRSWEPAVLTAGTLRTPFDVSPDSDLLERLDAAGYPVDRVVEEVGMRLLHESEAHLLNAAPGRPVLAVERTHYCGGRPVETSEMVGAADQCRLLYKLSLPRPPRP